MFLLCLILKRDIRTVSFANKFPKNTKQYKLMTTKPARVLNSRPTAIAFQKGAEKYKFLDSSPKTIDFFI